MNRLQQTLFFFFLLTIVFPFNLQLALGGENVAAKTVNYNTIAGEWQRIDGNYVLKIGDVLPEGAAIVEYYNPRPINVAKAAVSTENGFIKLFIKFQDKSYEGSTYTLVYNAKKDVLMGYYYQAPMDKTYEVMFARKN